MDGQTHHHTSDCWDPFKWLYHWVIMNAWSEWRGCKAAISLEGCCVELEMSMENSQCLHQNYS